jgi:hypothetical protein
MTHVRLSPWSRRMVVAECRQPADVAGLIASYTEPALPAWGELARDGHGDTAWWFRRPLRTWRAAVTGHGQRGIRSRRDLL